MLVLVVQPSLSVAPRERTTESIYNYSKPENENIEQQMQQICGALKI